MTSVFSWSDVTYSVKKKDILKGISGELSGGKVCAILGTYPYQVVRSCVQQRQVVGTDSVLYSSASETMRHIWRLEGAAGFYRGIWAHMLRSTPQATITLMLYEYSMRALAMLHPSTPHELV